MKWGGKSSKFLAYKLRKQQVDNTIYKIKNPTTKVIESKLGKIQESFETFYRTLYSQPQGSDEIQIEAFLNSLDLPKLTNSQNKNLIQSLN